MLICQALDEVLQERVVSSRNRSNPRAVKRTMTAYAVLKLPRPQIPRKEVDIRLVNP